MCIYRPLYAYKKNTNKNQVRYGWDNVRSWDKIAIDNVTFILFVKIF